MALYEIVKADGSRQKVEGRYGLLIDGCYEVVDAQEQPIVTYAPGTWLEVWRREGVSE